MTDLRTALERTREALDAGDVEALDARLSVMGRALMQAAAIRRIQRESRVTLAMPKEPRQ